MVIVHLNSGDVRHLRREEISENAIKACLELFSANRVAVPHNMLWKSTSKSRWCCYSELWQEEVHLASIGIAARSRCGASLWRKLHHTVTAPLLTESVRCPTEPWIAIRPEAGLQLNMLADKWLLAHEAAISWAWLDRTKST